MTAWTPQDLPNLQGRVYLITGGNAGIGYHTAYQLASRGATVHIACRDVTKGALAVGEAIKTIPQAKIHVLQMDLKDLNSVVRAANTFKTFETQLHGLVNNAGIMATPFELTVDGYEAQWQTNYLSHWVLTYHLLPLLRATALASPPRTVRIVNVSSMGHNYAPANGIEFDDISMPEQFTFKRYGQSKLANILHVKALDQHFGPETVKEGSICSVALHPGNVDTGLNSKAWGSIMVPALRCFGAYMTAEQGAWNSLWAVAGSQVEDVHSGAYVIPVGKVKAPNKKAEDVQLAEKLWEWTKTEMTTGGFIAA